jgi:hypothetical protein
MSFDTGKNDEARRLFRFSLACVEESEDWPFRALVLAGMARQAVWTGRPDEGLTYAEHALVREDRLPNVGKAMLHAARAKALAALRRTNEALRALSVSDSYFSRGELASAAPWPRPYSFAQHSCDTAAVLRFLDIERYRVEVRNRMTNGCQGHGENENLSRAMSEISLASMVMTVGDPLEAASIGTAALKKAGTISSSRVDYLLNALEQKALRHRDVPEVRSLRRSITDILTRPL